MPHTELEPFIDAAKARGAGDEFLASLLTRCGWPAGEVYDALGAWWEHATGVPLPARRTSAGSARDAFLYLLAFSMLATWASALGSLWFQLIEYWLPDPVFTEDYLDLRSIVTWQMAAILVALPIYLFVMRFILRESAASPDRMESSVRRWLTYIALLLTATGLVCDLVCFVGYFLRGELTLRFVLKCAVVLLICGSIFRYYFGFLKGRAPGRIFAGLAVAMATAGICFGLGLAGTPHRQRDLESDDRRVRDLRTIAGAIHNLPALPKSLDELAIRRRFVHVTDPQTGQPYEYIAGLGRQYELCAAFATDGSASPASASNFWRHTNGRACFQLDADDTAPW